MPGGGLRPDRADAMASRWWQAGGTWRQRLAHPVVGKLNTSNDNNLLLSHSITMMLEERSDGVYAVLRGNALWRYFGVQKLNAPLTIITSLRTTLSLLSRRFALPGESARRQAILFVQSEWTLGVPFSSSDHLDRVIGDSQERSDRSPFS